MKINHQNIQIIKENIPNISKFDNMSEFWFSRLEKWYKKLFRVNQLYIYHPKLRQLFHVNCKLTTTAFCPYT